MTAQERRARLDRKHLLDRRSTMYATAIIAVVMGTLWVALWMNLNVVNSKKIQQTLCSYQYQMGYNCINK